MCVCMYMYLCIYIYRERGRALSKVQVRTLSFGLVGSLHKDKAAVGKSVACGSAKGRCPSPPTSAETCRHMMFRCAAFEFCDSNAAQLHKIEIVSSGRQVLASFQQT